MSATTAPVHLILPVGTQVVSRVQLERPGGEVLCLQGAVGVIVKAPTDHSYAYQVQLGNGNVVCLKRHELSTRKQFQKDGLDQISPLMEELNLFDCVIFRCIVGSRAYGLEDAASDTDRRGIYLPSATAHWSIYGVPEQIENHATQECYWELQKFLILALKANPNVLECLYSPLVETATPLAQELLGLREIFLSKLVYQTYNGYVLSQFKKMEQDLRNTGKIRPKHAMHLIRLLLSGITILESGVVPTRVEQHRDQLLAIKYQQTSWEAVNQWRLQLHEQFDQAFSRSHLPERPDYERANVFLIAARRHQVDV
jgi:uncharacterized protein